MLGNVREWCEDWNADDYYAKSPASRPGRPVDGDAARFPWRSMDGPSCRMSLGLPRSLAPVDRRA